MDPISGVDAGGVAGGPATLPDGVSVRALQGLDEFRAAAALQVAVWGDGYADVVPASLLKVVNEVGGVALGAFAGTRLVGFVFGLTGPRDGEIAHWSHMLGVLPEWRDRGVGRALKNEQARVLRERGVTAMLWTFDPLVARNAHLNLTRLGVSVVRYATDMYGDTGSAVHSFGTDRLVVRWALNERASPFRSLPEGAFRAVPVLDPMDPSTMFGRNVRIAVPWDVEAMAHEDLDAARRWRARLRAEFTVALSNGFKVVGFDRPDTAGTCHYLLSRGGRR